MELNEFKIQAWDLLRSISEGLGSTLQHVDADCGLTAVQMRVLRSLKAGDKTVGMLAKSMGMAGTNMSVICKRLEKEGLVYRSRDHQDERVVRVSATDKGRELVLRSERELEAYYQPLWEKESPQTAQTILAGLREFDQLLKRLNAPQSKE